jgi:hypothetical protein
MKKHTASRLERDQPCRKKKGSRGQGMQYARTASPSEESTWTVRRTRASWRILWQEVPQVHPEVSGVRATTRGSFATEEIVLNTAPATLNQRVTPSRATVMGTSKFGRGHKLFLYHAREQSSSPQSGSKGACQKGYRGKGAPQQRQSEGAATEGSTCRSSAEAG